LTLIQYFFRCLLGRNPLPLNGAIGPMITSDGHLTIGAYRSLHRRSNGRHKAKPVQMNQDAHADRINILRPVPTLGAKYPSYAEVKQRRSARTNRFRRNYFCNPRIIDRGTCCSQQFIADPISKIISAKLRRIVRRFVLNEGAAVVNPQSFPVTRSTSAGARRTTQTV